MGSGLSPGIPYLIQLLPADAAGEVVEDSSSAWVPTPTPENLEKEPGSCVQLCSNPAVTAFWGMSHPTHSPNPSLLPILHLK